MHAHALAPYVLIILNPTLNMPNSSPLFLAETITNWYGPDAHGDAANQSQSVFLVLPFSRKTRASPREEGGGLRASDAGPAGPRRPPRNGHRDETDHLRLRAQSAARDRIRAALRAANLSSERDERTLDEAHRARVSLGDALNALPDDAAVGAGDVRGGDLDEDEGGGGSTEAGDRRRRGARKVAEVERLVGEARGHITDAERLRREVDAAVLASGAARRGAAPGAGAREVATNEGHVQGKPNLPSFFIKKIMTVAFSVGSEKYYYLVLTVTDSRQEVLST